ncbi:MAG TPA: iron ABC transporter permease, partial [Acinetobacter radioresistens]|nr:iron ABC transporter permease [Acinetobacter radioresistens]
LNFKTTLSVIINFVGGIYFFWILLKENKKWQLS